MSRRIKSGSRSIKSMKCKDFIKKFQSGQSLIELLIAIGISAILMPAFLTSFATSRGGRAQQEERLQAITYVREAEEAVRIIRDNGWESFAALGNGTFCPQPIPGGTTWELVTLSDPTKTTTCDHPATGLTRTITISNAVRDNTTHLITLGSGTTDPSTKTITITVSWVSPISSLISQIMYVTRHDNLSFLDTSTTDFGNGTKSGTTVTNIYGGEVQIGGGGSNDWCAPGTPVTFQTSSNHNEYAISAFASTGVGVNSYAYTTFGDSANGHVLDKWNVTNTNPPVPSSGGNYNPNGEKSYGLFATSSAVFETSNKNNLTVDIVDPSTLTRSGTFQDSGGEPGRGVYVGYTNSGVEGFVIVCGLSGTSCSSNYKMYSFDYHTTPLTGARTQNGSVNLTAEGKRIVVANGIAFVAENNTSTQLEAFDVRNPSSMSKINFSYTGGSIASKQSTAQGATDIFVDSSGKFAFLVTAYDSQADIFYLDLSSLTYTGGTIKVLDSISSSVASGGTMSPNGVIAVSQNHVVVVGSGGNQYQVFNLINSKLSRCVSGNNGMLNIGANVKAVSAVSESDGDNYAYILTDDANKELQIIPGGEGTGTGGTGSGTGTFISQPIPVPTLSANATFNSFFPIADTPIPTTIRYQFGVAPTCSSTFTFLGPGGTSLTTDTYATTSAIPILTSGGYQNPGECFKYKAYLNSNGSTTASPILYQVKVNYSP